MGDGVIDAVLEMDCAGVIEVLGVCVGDPVCDGVCDPEGDGDGVGEGFPRKNVPDSPTTPAIVATTSKVSLTLIGK